jgi:4-hydroxybenzoate polyprenyltransferase
MAPRILAYAQLLRLPNVFTAFADVLMAACAAGYVLKLPVIGMLIGTGCLYLAGMVWNDIFDRHEDARTRPFRPIPSQRVPLRNAVILGIVLLAVGWVAMSFGLSQGPWQEYAALLPGLLVAAILLYDAWLKRTVAGPVAMGACRFVNVLLCYFAGSGHGHPPELAWHLAAVIGVYIVGVTWFARTEEGTSQKAQLVPAACVLAAALLLAAGLPWHLAPDSAPVYFIYLLAAYGLYLARPVSEAIRVPTPKHVQNAVKASILGLILFDAILAAAFVGWPGLLLVLLLIPARRLGKWVYST